MVLFFYCQLKKNLEKGDFYLIYLKEQYEQRVTANFCK